MNYSPLGDSIIVRRLPEEKITPGGIWIPVEAQEKQSRGYVIAVGPGKIQKNGKRKPIDVKVGELVVFGKYAGSELEQTYEDLLILNEYQIIGVIE